SRFWRRRKGRGPERPRVSAGKGVMPMKVAVVKESAPGERRVALVPETVQKLRQAGLEVLVEKGAGDSAWFPDGAYTEAGATVTTTDNLYATADVVLTVTRPDEAALGMLRPGQAVIGMLAPLTDPHLARTLAERGVTAISLDGLPRTLSRAQGMDALTSQANVAGYKAALVAAEAYGRFFPLLITAAHTARQDVIITTAQVPGRRPPLLVTAEAVAAMAPGSVIVDMGASPLGGNVAGSVPGEAVVTPNGVTVIGAENLAASVPTAASNAYSRNISALLLQLVSAGDSEARTLNIDTTDDIQAGVVVAHGGEVVHPAVAKLLADESANQGS